MKVYVTLNGGHEARITGVFSTYEDASRYCVQYCKEGGYSSIEMLVEEYEIDKEIIMPEYQRCAMPYGVELDFDGRVERAEYSSTTTTYDNRPLPTYHEQYHEDCCPGCYCNCMALNYDEAVVIARKMQKEFVDSGQREKDLKIAYERATKAAERRKINKERNL